MYKTEFYVDLKNGLNYFKYAENDLVAKGHAQVFNKIDSLNNNEKAKDNLDFYLIKSPIEFFDEMNLNIEDKEKIELIDFPGLDTDFKEATKKAENLLKIIDGFIYVNFQIHFDEGDTNIISLMYNTIKKRKHFSFGTCLFVLNKIDTLERGTKINLDEVSQSILNIFDEENQYLPSTDVIGIKERIEDKSLSLTKFSSKKYKEYKSFETHASNFDNFILYNSKQIEDKETKEYNYFNFSFSFSLDSINIFKSENILNNIKKNLKKKYIKIDKKEFEKFKPDEKIIQQYLDKLINVIKKYFKNEKNLDKKDMNKIVNLYLYILHNKKKYNSYIFSYFNDFKENYEKVIEKSKYYFKIKQQNQILYFMQNCYNQIIEI